MQLEHCIQISPFLSLCMFDDAHERFKVLTRLSKISFLSFIFQYIFRITFTSNKVFYFSQVNVFIACHLSQIFPKSDRRAWFYLVQNFRFFISKTFDFLFSKKEVFLENSYSWILYSLGHYSREYLNVKIPHSKLFQREYLFPGGSIYLLVNK